MYNRTHRNFGIRSACRWNTGVSVGSEVSRLSQSLHSQLKLFCYNIRYLMKLEPRHKLSALQRSSINLKRSYFSSFVSFSPKLTWRDLQHIVVRTSKPDKLKSNDWVTNGVGRRISHRFGYGLLDAHALVELAEKWKRAPKKCDCSEAKDTTPR